MKDQTALAALVGVSRARVTQVPDPLHLAPDIRGEFLDPSGAVERRDGIRERDLRVIAAEPIWLEQRPLRRVLASP